MIQECRTYFCNYPHDEEILEAMEIVKRDKCIIKLMWNVDYSGTYSVIIASYSTLESVKEQIPKVYGV